LGPNLKFRPALTTLTLVVTLIGAVATRKPHVVQTNVFNAGVHRCLNLEAFDKIYFNRLGLPVQLGVRSHAH
jgi:hypothetical protein